MTSRRRTFEDSRISGPGELLQAVPYLLGFHPAGSLVLIGLHDARLVVTARLDLTETFLGGVEHAVAAMVRGGSTSFVSVVYGDDPVPIDADDLPWADLASTVRAAVEEGGAELRDALLVSGGRWWSYVCSDASCCPAEGRELPAAPSAFTTAATVAGVVALPDRAALEAVLDPLADQARGALDPAISAAEDAAVRHVVGGHARRWELSAKRALFKAARAADEVGWAGVSDDVAAYFGVALAVTAIRDAVWMAIDDRRLDGRLLWRDLARRLPGPYDAPALFLYGWASWRAGEGALARTAADRAIESDPAYTAADLLRSAIVNGVNPRRMPRLRLPRSAR